MACRQYFHYGTLPSCLFIVLISLLQIIFLDNSDIDVNRTRASSNALIVQTTWLFVCIVLTAYMSPYNANEEDTFSRQLDYRFRFYCKTLVGNILLAYDIFLFAALVANISLVYTPNNTYDWTKWNIAASVLVSIRAGILFASILTKIDTSVSREYEDQLHDKLEKTESLLTPQKTDFSIDTEDESENDEETWSVATEKAHNPSTRHIDNVAFTNSPDSH